MANNLPVSSLKSFSFAVPPQQEASNIASYLETKTSAIQTTVSRLEREIGLIQEYRTRLIADVVTGKLDVREAAAGLPDLEEPAESLEEVTDLEEELDDIEGEGEA